MSLLFARRCFPSFPNSTSAGLIRCRHVSIKTCDPLRVLFLGSEEFSIASLRALDQERLACPDTIKSIDVVCRPGKRVGRGLKTVRHPPIKSVATELGLRVHEIDTFRGWSLPLISSEPVNLIVAVSFGLFVPPRILKTVKYGGLNVHPSLLPDFRGPAPLHHTLLTGETKTGITLQTLHAKKFDHGTILDQTPPPGIDVPIECTLPYLRDLLAPIAAQMLVQGIRQRSFVPPVKDVGWYEGKVEDGALRHAAKITPEDSHVQWKTWTGEEILRRYRVLGPLWNYATPSSMTDSTSLKRIKVAHLRLIPTTPVNNIEPGIPYFHDVPEIEKSSKYLVMNTSDGKMLEIGEVTVEGHRPRPSFNASVAAGLMKSQEGPDGPIWTFHKSLC